MGTLFLVLFGNTCLAKYSGSQSIWKHDSKEDKNTFETFRAIQSCSQLSSHIKKHYWFILCSYASWMASNTFTHIHNNINNICSLIILLCSLFLGLLPAVVFSFFFFSAKYYFQSLPNRLTRIGFQWLRSITRHLVCHPWFYTNLLSSMIHELYFTAASSPRSIYRFNTEDRSWPWY